MTARADLTIIHASYWDDLLGPGEVRALAGGVTRRTLAQWRDGHGLGDRGPFPAPVRELDIGPIWDRRHVTAWLKGPDGRKRKRKAVAA